MESYFDYLGKNNVCSRNCKTMYSDYIKIQVCHVHCNDAKSRIFIIARHKTKRRFILIEDF